MTGTEKLEFKNKNWLLTYVSESSPINKFTFFYIFAALAFYFTGYHLLLAIITVIYCVIFFPFILIFKPDRTFSEPTMLEYYRLGFGDKKTGMREEAIEGEIVQPVKVKQSISARARIVNIAKKKSLETLK